MCVGWYTLLRDGYLKGLGGWELGEPRITQNSIAHSMRVQDSLFGDTFLEDTKLCNQINDLASLSGKHHL